MPTIKTIDHRKVKIDDVQPHPDNVREGDVGVIVESLEYHDQYREIVVQKSSMLVIAGNHTWKAAKASGMTRIGVGIIDVDDDEALRILAMDNRANDLATYDDLGLRDMLIGLNDTADGLMGTGYDGDDLDQMMLDLEPKPEVYDQPIPDKADPIVKRGDVWRLGPHRLMCGDSIDDGDIATLMDGAAADLVVTSPPYNVGLKYGVYDDKAIDVDDYLAFIDACVAAWVQHIGPGRMVAWNVGTSRNTSPYRHLAVLERHLRFWRNIVWAKIGVPLPAFHNTLASPDARRYHPHYTHELIGLYVNGDEPTYGDTIQLPAEGQRDVWDWIAQAQASVDLPKRSNDPTNRGTNLDRRVDKVHPAVFPIGVPATVIGYLTAPDEIVVDPFMGAGTTIIAADQLGRIAYGMEIDPEYCDITIARYKTLNPSAKVKRVLRSTT